MDHEDLSHAGLEPASFRMKTLTEVGNVQLLKLKSCWSHWQSRFAHLFRFSQAFWALSRPAVKALWLPYAFSSHFRQATSL